MIMKIFKFNEGWFTKKGEVTSNSPIDQTIKPGVRTTIPRPEDVVPTRLSDDDRQKQINDLKTKDAGDRVDPYFIQEISDRLYGPDSEDYIDALKELNKNFRPREGRYGNQFYDDEISSGMNIKKFDDIDEK